ncbi:MAG: SAM-dependent methyltransferase [Deltaproteobacteria bacterium]|nr:SAM-dependent methyltransferase [Deltaproteobacteria bacterium]
MPAPGLNLTSDYYTGAYPSLLWEMTVCQSLGDGHGTFARALKKPAAYGFLLADYLQRETSLPVQCGKIVEVGGGYGTLMAALLEALKPQSVTMVDISPTLLEKQKIRLKKHPAAFHCEDIFSWLKGLKTSLDLLILNEIIGDFPTITNIAKNALSACQPGKKVKPNQLPLPAELNSHDLLAEAARLINTYKLNIADLPETFNLNYGALRFIEQLAETEVARTFISEHGSDTLVPYPFSLYPAIVPTTDRNPRCIRLKDHNEYNIRFAHLAQIAEALNFKVKRLHLMDLLQVRFDDEIDYLLRTRQPVNEEQEIFLEFYEHIAEYQGIILQR